LTVETRMEDVLRTDEVEVPRDDDDALPVVLLQMAVIVAVPAAHALLNASRD